MVEKCRAKNPSSCRFHNPSFYDSYSKYIVSAEKELTTTTDFERAVELRGMVEEFKTKQDATIKGWKKLQKEFKQSVGSSDFEHTAYLASRLQKAAELRKEDGKLSPWAAARENPKTFYAKIFDEASYKNEVPIPLTGTATWGDIGHEIVNRGYKVTDVEIMQANEVESPQEEFKLASERAVDFLNNPTSAGGQLYNPINGIPVGERYRTDGEPDPGFMVRGLSYEDKEGRIIRVYSDASVTDLNF